MATRAKHIAFGKATFLGMHIKVPSRKNWPRISSSQEWRLEVRNMARDMAEIRGKRVGAALSKIDVTMLARALRKGLRPSRPVSLLAPFKRKTLTELP